MVDTQVMSTGNLGLSVRTHRAHTRTVSDLGSPKFVLHRLDPAASMTGSPRFVDAMSTVQEDAVHGDTHSKVDGSVNGVNPSPFLENGGTKVLAGSNPYLESGELENGTGPRSGQFEEEGSGDIDSTDFMVGEAPIHPIRSKSDGVIMSIQSVDPEDNENPFSPGTVLESPGADSADSHYFELEIARREAENQVEQLKLQLRSKSSQLEQVQIALMSYEEEIMRIRKNGVDTSDGGSSRSDQGDNEPGERPQQQGVLPLREKIPLGIAEDLSKKIVFLQTNVQDLEEEMVRVKLENAQLRETNDFLKNTLSKTSKREGGRGIRNPFSRAK
ncbi:hypothetical protein BSKO_13599 [Bryopsis sp. KO-2023]|nr:hypothetical protein BSKO_13599 [Bryopsis sp. KO-2023]